MLPDKQLFQRKMDAKQNSEGIVMICAVIDCNYMTCFGGRYCSKHSRVSKKLYLGYKKQQKHIDQYLQCPSNLRNSSNETLLSVMYRCNKVIKLRRVYKETFCLPEHKGHEGMILQLIELADQILQLLTERFKVGESPASDETSFSSSDEINLEITWIETTIKKLSLQRCHLQEELKQYIDIKMIFVNEIKKNIIKAVSQINPYLRDGDLSLDDKASFIVCSIVSVRNITSQATCEECDGLTCPRLLLDWDAYPENLENLVEAIYQHRAPSPKLQDGEINLRCLAMLIDEARLRRTSFIYHFKMSVVNLIPIWEIITHDASKEIVKRARKSKHSFV